MFKRKKERENYDALDDIEIFDDPADMKRSRTGERVRLSKDKRRSYLTLLISLAAVLAASSCVLVLLLINSSNKRQEAADAKDMEMAEKLGQIEDYLTAIDTKVADDTMSNATADNYRQLSTTVDSLKSNLTQYRDDNDITNGEIGSNLDDVISQLGKIQTDLDKRYDEQKGEDSVLDNRLDNISKSSKEAEDSLSSDLDRVHESISSLIEKTGEDQTGNYLELKGILSATDSNLSDLVSDRFNAEGQLIAEKTNQLSKDIGSVKTDINSVRSDVSGSLQAVDTKLAAVNQSLSDNTDSINTVNEQMSESIVTLNENLTSVNEGVIQKIDSNSEYVREIENRVSELKSAVEQDITDSEKSLDKIKGSMEDGFENSKRLEKKVDELQGLIEKICRKLNIGTGEEENAEGQGSSESNGETDNKETENTGSTDNGRENNEAGNADNGKENNEANGGGDNANENNEAGSSTDAET